MYAVRVSMILYIASVKQLQKGQKTHQATSGHVMLSYQTANRKVVRMICDFLKKNVRKTSFLGEGVHVMGGGRETGGGAYHIGC